MKKLVASLVALAALAPMSQSLAATVTAWAKISRITVDNDQTTIFISGTLDNPAGCTSPAAAVLPNTTGNYETITAAALTGFAGGFDVQLKIHDTVCALNSPKVLHVSLRP